MANVAETTGSELTRLESRGSSILEQAESMKITDNASCHQVDLAISQTVGMLKEREGYWAPIISLIKKNLELTQGKRKDMLRPVLKAQAILVAELAEWKAAEAARYSAAYDKKKKENEDAGIAAAFEMATQGESPEAIRAMTELAQSNEGIEVAHFEVKTKTSIEPDWEVKLLKGQEREVPAKWLIPRTETARKAVAQTIKNEVVRLRGHIEPIPGVTIKPIHKSTMRG